MSLKNRAKLVSRWRFTLTAADYNVRLVYATGTLYWLGHDARVTMAFDLVKQRGRVTDGPVNGENRTGDMWFGYAAGSVRFVHSLQEEIMIYGLSGEWRVEHRIANINNPSNNYYKHGQCIHFDGGRLFFLVRAASEDGHVYVYDLSRKKWEKSDWRVRGWDDWLQYFFSFFPTNAKVINEKKKEKVMEELELELKVNEAVLLGLHRLMKPTAEYKP